MRTAEEDGLGDRANAHPLAGKSQSAQKQGQVGGPGAQQPTQNDTWVANKYTFKCSASPLVREMQLKPEELTLQHPRAEQSVRLRMSALRKTGTGVHAATSGRCLMTFKDSEGARLSHPGCLPRTPRAWRRSPRCTR